ncbi:MAG: DUF3726 domain-containing protein [Candidatus Zeuxoniibacter abyssi]|nr:MAG: DUF3726 domain-containing protein [Candidatus Persebacteraceae bacterium AB1(2)]
MEAALSNASFRVMKSVLSLGEISFVVFKAARGAGFAWGLAEEAGHAARWLTTQGLFEPIDFYNALIKTLPPPREPKKLRPPPDAKALCPFRLGALLCDGAENLPDRRAYRVSHPLLLAACLAPAAGALQKSFALSWRGAKITITRHIAITGGDNLHANFADVVQIKALSPPLSPPAGLAKPNAISPNTSGWRRLTTLAGKILVPSSEDSTIKGAGAGLTDND